VTTHGVSVNCDTDLSWFRHIVPCGVNGKSVTSITKELNSPTPITNVIRPFLAAFSEEFQCELDLSLLDSTDAELIHKSEEVGEVVGEGTEQQVRVGGMGAPVPPAKAAAQQRWMSTQSVFEVAGDEEAAEEKSAHGAESTTTTASTTAAAGVGSDAHSVAQAAAEPEAEASKPVVGNEHLRPMW
jgi:hypothetical protein